MKRFILWTLILAAGAGLGAGGFFAFLNWDELNPFKSDEPTGYTQESFGTHLRQQCMTDKELKGAAILPIQITDKKLILRGWIAAKEQRSKIESLAQAMLNSSPKLQADCRDGIKIFLTVLPLDQHLSQLQHDFDEARGAQGEDDALKRSVMRTTRLDKAVFLENAQLKIDAVCIRGSGKTDVTAKTLEDAIRARFVAAGIAPEQVPVLKLDVRYFTSPAVLLQKELARSAATKSVFLTAAWYDGLGKLHIDGIVGSAAQRPLVNKAIDAIVKDPSNAPIFRNPASADEKIAIELNLVRLDDIAMLQKELAAQARKENRPTHRRIRLISLTPVPQVTAKNEPITDDEGNPAYAFRVVCRSLLGKDAEREKAERELLVWLNKRMPKIVNPDQAPVPLEIEFRTQLAPAIALQDRLIERGLDGAVITDALFDEAGKLELLGRLHQDGDDAKQALAAAFKDLLAEEPGWSANLTPHSARMDGQPIAWPQVVRNTQAALAVSNAGKLLRLDRLCYRYVDGKLRLVPEGTLLTGANKSDPAKTLAAAIDDVISSRGSADVFVGSLKAIANPVPALQNLSAERPELDGVLLTNARYDAGGRLQLGGYLGKTDQKAVLATLVENQLAKMPGLLRVDAEPRATAGWSIDGMKVHSSGKTDLAWSDVVRGCQGALAGDAGLRRASIERMHFRYADPLGLKPTLVWKATCLTKPGEPVNEPALTRKIADRCKSLLPDLPAHHIEAALTKAESPIFALQDLAVKAPFDGLLFQDAYYDSAGKLVLEGKRGSDEQLKDIKTLLDRVIAESKPPIAPAGVAGLERMTLVPWQPLLADIRTQFAAGDALHKQTRIDRLFFQHDQTAKKTIICVHGICIYQGAKLTQEAQTALWRGVLRKQLEARGIDDFTLDLGGIVRKPNPVSEMQKRVIDTELDGVVFSIGFDAKGVCWVRIPIIPDKKEAKIRALVDEFSKKHKDDLRELEFRSP